MLNRCVKLVLLCSVVPRWWLAWCVPCVPSYCVRLVLSTAAVLLLFLLSQGAVKCCCQLSYCIQCCQSCCSSMLLPSLLPVLPVYALLAVLCSLRTTNAFL